MLDIDTYLEYNIAEKIELMKLFLKKMKKMELHSKGENR